MSTRPPPLRIPLHVIVAIWSVPAWLTTFQFLLFAGNAARSVTLFGAFLAEGSPWYLWVLATPVIVYLVQRPMAIRSVPLVLHLPVLLAMAVLYGGTSAYCARFIRPGAVFSAAVAMRWSFGTLPITVVSYAGVTGICYAWIMARQLGLRERDTERLEAELGRAELSALRMQLQPHFLFNSLNSIMALVRDRETEASIEALAFLGDVLRTTLRAGHAHEVSLGEELEFTRRYLAIEQLRFADRLQFQVDVPDPLHQAAVPVFLLQPLVENALRHGILSQRDGGQVAIAVRAEGDLMVVTVTDTGPGLPAEGAGVSVTGIGLANTRSRLALLYGEMGHLVIRNRTGRSGVEVRVELPLRYLSSLPSA